MTTWKKKLLHFFGTADEFLAAVNYKIRARLHLYQDVYISTYNSYGTASLLYVRGRVLENKNIRPAKKEDSLFINVMNMYKRFYGEKVPGATVEILFQNKTYTTVSDETGYFEHIIVPEKPLPDILWHKVELRLKNGPRPFKGAVQAYSRVMVPLKNTSFGIISDIDDTIIKSYATAKLKMFSTVTFKNALTRHPFADVSGFYDSLLKGPEGTSQNPFFYVSSSPWRLNDFLLDFLDINKIPEGAFLLKNLGTAKEKNALRGHRLHKLHAITKILNTYPDMDFILIGDSGQKDAFIYSEIAKKFPDRIKIIYIRDVQLPKNAVAVLTIAAKMPEKGCKMLLVESLAEAKKHAKKIKLIL
jgi:phosphatidate phosphatase APP1